MANQLTSAVPQVKGALVDLFAAALATAGVDPAPGTPVTVFYGVPNESTRECAVVGGTLNPAEQQWAALGAARRNQVLVLEVWVETSEWPDQRTATERAYALHALLETALRAKPNGPTLGLQASFRSIIAESDTEDLQEFPEADGHGWGARVAWAVKASVQI